MVYGIDLARASDFTVLIGFDEYLIARTVERFQMPWAITKSNIQTMVGEVPCVVDATGVGDAIVEDLQTMGVNAYGFIFTQPSKLNLMQRLITAFQGEEMKLPESHEWLKAELESFEHTYSRNGVRYEAPKGLHDDGVMALGLALHGWDRVQGIKPTEPKLLQPVGDDPYHVDGYDTPGPIAAGDYQNQLPAGW